MQNSVQLHSWRLQPVSSTAMASYASTEFGHCTSEDEVVFEKSPNYNLQAWTARRMCEVLGTPRLVVLLREPVARAYSAFWQFNHDETPSDFSGGIIPMSAEGFHTLAVVEAALVGGS